MTTPKRGRPPKPAPRPTVPAFRDREDVVDALNREAVQKQKSVAEVLREILRARYRLPA